MAGFTVAQDNECHAAQIQAHQVWKRDPSACPSTRTSDPAGRHRADDLAYTRRRWTTAAQVLGARCVLSNFSLAQRRPAATTARCTPTCISLGGSIDFQTATVAKMGDYTQVLAYAASLGAHSVELPTGYTAWSTATLAGYAQEMADS